MTDLTYTQDNMFTRFFPHTESGEDAWRVIAEQNEGCGNVFNGQAKSTIAQLRNAGYSVSKAKPHKPLTADELDSLLAELEV